MNKKGIEMSMSFLVTIIIAIVIFIFGVNFIYDLSSNADDLSKRTLEDLDKQFASLLCEETEKVCLPVDNIVIPKGKFDTVGLKITNIYKKDYLFEIKITQPETPGYKKDNYPMDNEESFTDSQGLVQGFLFHSDITIKRNDQRGIAIGIQVPKNAASGTHIFNIEVSRYDTLHKLRVNVP